MKDALLLVDVVNDFLAIDARELGFKVTVLADACACVDPRLERSSLEYLEAAVGVFVEPSRRDGHSEAEGG